MRLKPKRNMNFKFHTNFKINNTSFSEKELIVYANKLSKSDLEYENHIGEFLFNWLDETDFVLVKTSGTTGKPKEIRLLKSSMIASAKATNQFYDLKENHDALLCLSAQFIAGKMMLVRAMVSGMNIDFIAPNAEIILNKRYYFVAMVPLQAEKSLLFLDKIDFLIIGGAPISNTLNEKLLATNCNVFETYGMTETITHIALKNIKNPYFKTLPGITIGINEDNCLYANVHYIKDTIQTNDIIKLYNENQFEWLGRADNTINSGGVKIQPEEIENILKQHIPHEFYISYLPDEILGQKIVLIVEAKQFSIDFNQVLGLSKYQIPKKVILVDVIEKTLNGKIIRKKL
jgi:o-succinylbenzoate---CoA ligase